MAKRMHEMVSRESANPAAQRVKELKRLFPEAVTEGRLDFDKLRESLGDQVDDRPERYAFTWAGKRDAIRLLSVPSRATLVPDREQSVEFDTTKNLFICRDCALDDDTAANLALQCRLKTI